MKNAEATISSWRGGSEKFEDWEGGQKILGLAGGVTFPGGNIIEFAMSWNITTSFWNDCEYLFLNMLKNLIIKALCIQVTNLQLQIYEVTILGSGAFFSNC